MADAQAHSFSEHTQRQTNAPPMQLPTEPPYASQAHTHQVSNAHALETRRPLYTHTPLTHTVQNAHFVAHPSHRHHESARAAQPYALSHELDMSQVHRGASTAWQDRIEACFARDAQVRLHSPSCTLCQQPKHITYRRLLHPSTGANVACFSGRMYDSMTQ